MMGKFSVKNCRENQNTHFVFGKAFFFIENPAVYEILPYSMVQGRSWAASQEIPRISRNPKVHYRTHKRPPPVSILGPPDPVHIPTSHLPEIQPNIIHPSTPRPPQWSLSLRLPNQDHITPLSSPIRATCPAHPLLHSHIQIISRYNYTSNDFINRKRTSLACALCNLNAMRHVTH